MKEHVLLNIQKKLFTIKVTGFTLLLSCSIFFFGCQPRTSLNTSMSLTSECSFKIHVLDYNWNQLGSPYSIDEAWPRLKKRNLNNSVFIIDLTDIKSYDWKQQKIVLTPQGTNRLITKLSKDWQHIEPAFAVTVDNDWLYGGVFYKEFGAAAIQFPVIHLDQEGSQISLRIRPGLGFIPFDSWDVIKLEKIKNCFQKTEKLKIR